MKSHSRKRWLVSLALAVVAVCVAAGGALAAITSTGGSAVKVAPPPGSVEYQALQSNTRIVAFDEQQCVTLTSDLAVDIKAGGGSGVIPAGTSVNSHFLHFDPTGSAVVTLNGSITTDTPVLGVITSGANLNASDSLGAPGTTYPTDAERGLEPAGPAPADGDSAAISTSNTVSVTLKDRFHFDQVRVISQCKPTGNQGCTPGYWKQPHHFDSWAGYAPTDKYETVFGVDVPGNPSLADALGANGGGINALERHSTAAVLNASNPNVAYALTVSQVIAKVQAAVANGTIEQTKDELAGFNERVCPLS